MVAAYRAHMPGRVAAETNMGGQLVASVLRTVDPLLSLTTGHAARSKPARAESVAARMSRSARIMWVSTCISRSSCAVGHPVRGNRRTGWTRWCGR